VLIIFAHELTGLLSRSEARKIISDIPSVPTSIIRAVEDLELKSIEILQEIEVGRIYGNESTRSIYFAWELPFTPAIGWKFCAPMSMELGDYSLATISNIYFGSGDTLLCEYE